MKTLIICILLSFNVLFAQEDSLFIRSIYNEALSNGHSYDDLRSLCKDIGARITGSAEAEMAIEWGKAKMEGYEFDHVFLQEIEVPHWERGTKEAGWLKKAEGELTKVHILALGGSIGTNGVLEGKIIEFNHLDELREVDAKKVEGKIVFLNQPMDEQQINTFRAYGGCYPIRGDGAVEASRKGAKGVIIRSLGLPVDEHPHTGSMHYNDSVAKIPAAAVSTQDADMISNYLSSNKGSFVMEMDCRDYPDTTSHNVIGDLIGNEKPDEFIVFGGHLDSWDTGEGAHDDGAGVVHCLEALRILNELGYKPKHTLRLVFFMNEENGNRGGKGFAEYAEAEGLNVIAAVESDRGGFAPRGFHCDGSEEQIAFLQTLQPLFKPYDLHIFEKGYGGVDIGPLHRVFPEIPLFGFVPDSQRYFDFHHAPSDVFENVNKRELELGAASIAAFIYLLDQNL